jgi:MFS family permease
MGATVAADSTATKLCLERVRCRVACQVGCILDSPSPPSQYSHHNSVHDRGTKTAQSAGGGVVDARDRSGIVTGPGPSEPATAPPENPPWLGRAIVGMTATSFLSDFGHEAQSTLLPSFMAGLGLPPVALGAVEGIADATASFVKLGAGWFSDRLGRRKPFVVAGYAATGFASGIIALAGGLPLILLGKMFGWFGRGIRSPLRDAMLSDAIPASARGRAFGFHRFGDTLGAVLGPLLAVLLLSAFGGSQPLDLTRTLIAWSLVPGVLAALAFWVLVPERGRGVAAPRTFHHALRGLPKPFRRYLVGVGAFGIGDFAHTMLILAATQWLAPAYGTVHAAAIGAGLYVFHNVVYALVAYPAGALADKIGHRRVLAGGYALSVMVPVLLIAASTGGLVSLPLFVAIFAIAGIVGGVQDTLEGAATAGLVAAEDRGLGFGVLGAVNGIGDLASSLIVGALWMVHPALGFGYAAACMAIGAVVVARTAGSREDPT